MNGLVVMSLTLSVTIGCCFWGIHLQLHVDQKIKMQGVLWMAAGVFSQVVQNILMGLPTLAALHAVGIAFLLWIWWNKGGGDGLKRRLKKWTESLRSTFAPQTA